MYKLKFNGTSKRNSGICGAGFIIYKDDIPLVHEHKMVSLNNTNSFAEYSALLLGIKKVIELEIKDISMESDNAMIIKQLNKIIDVQSSNLIPLFNESIEELVFFDSFQFMHIKKKKNEFADKLATYAIKEYCKHNMEGSESSLGLD
jgi:ribonuclease HI